MNAALANLGFELLSTIFIFPASIPHFRNSWRKIKRLGEGSFGDSAEPL
jgi:hypothetical protein